jgi:hypothetical protein
MHAAGEAEIGSLLNEITRGGTYLFRSPLQLDALRKIVIPSLAGEKKNRGVEEIACLERGLLHRGRTVHARNAPARRDANHVGRLHL